jgi:hypothetical protein
LYQGVEIPPEFLVDWIVVIEYFPVILYAKAELTLIYPYRIKVI